MSNVQQHDDPTIFSEVISAGFGGAIAASILYPLEVIKTKMQVTQHVATTKNTNTNKTDEDEEPCDNCTDKDDHNQTKNNNITDDTSKKGIKNSSLLLKNDDDINDGMIPFTMNLYKQEGYEVFIRGMEISALRSFLEKALYFAAYTSLKKLYYSFYYNNNSKNHFSRSGGDVGLMKPQPKQQMNAITNLIVGCLAEWVHLPITLPVDVWTTRIQTSNDKPMKVLLTMLKSSDHHKNGSNNLYNGLSAYYILCFKPALQYTIYEQLKSIITRSKSVSHHHHHRQRGDSDPVIVSTSLSSSEAFVLGMIARTVSTILVYPFIRAKVLLQQQQSQQYQQQQCNKTTTTTEEKVPSSISTSSSTIDLLWTEYQKLGSIHGLYQGMGPELTRGILSTAFMFMFKEKMMNLLQGSR